MLIAVLSLWFNADGRLLAAAFGPAGEAQALAAADHGHAPVQVGHEHGGAPAGDDQGDASLDHTICSAHCVPAIVAMAAQALPSERFDRIAIARLPDPSGCRADPPLIPPKHRS
ncbi:MAG: hypothetical protein KJ904_04975 [Alphaproteobacteria bacterium]|nr:hypothetical protein [Alphaproteobacteria bacterium]MBU0796611.1 hypothetical protein [Alphaproteobacteria bacterium]MBU0886498.1 hypothetical protein [Alphaproteobacteria bacterium]MBU1814086.1 hypothetical protein [Alphaproteobacteria bacterium]MBU2090443.1 hypothetical protein [Alphaproteobacteria bacterium]